MIFVSQTTDLHLNSSYIDYIETNKRLKGAQHTMSNEVLNAIEAQLNELALLVAQEEIEALTLLTMVDEKLTVVKTAVRTHLYTWLGDESPKMYTEQALSKRTAWVEVIQGIWDELTDALTWRAILDNQ